VCPNVGGAIGLCNEVCRDGGPQHGCQPRLSKTKRTVQTPPTQDPLLNCTCIKQPAYVHTQLLHPHLHLHHPAALLPGRLTHLAACACRWPGPGGPSCGTAAPPHQSACKDVSVFVCECVYVCGCACVCVCMHVWECVCARKIVCVR